jgi:hypothetical protein
LLFTAPPANEAALQQLVSENGEGEIFCVRRITAGQGVHLLGPEGEHTEITYQGMITSIQTRKKKTYPDSIYSLSTFQYSTTPVLHYSNIAFFINPMSGIIMLVYAQRIFMLG